jgi:Bacterial membrane protein YfhO
MGVYECAPDTRRAYVVTAASVVPDVKTQLSWLFDESFEAESTVMLERPAPAAAGEMGTPVPAFARISYDAAHEVVVDASAGAEGGYLVLLDSYDPYWEVEVDGRAAPLLRANALFRAVHLVPGRHTIKFVYRPTSLYVSAAVSGLAAIALGLLALRRPRKERDVVRVGATEARGERAPEMAANALH